MINVTISEPFILIDSRALRDNFIIYCNKTYPKYKLL